MTLFISFNEGAEAIRRSLSLDLATFIERAYIANNRNSFFYYAYSEDDHTRYIALYSTNDFESHPVGLIFDQKHHTAIICVDVDDIDTVCNGFIVWYPPKRVLEAWLDMIEKGKAIVTTNSGDSEDPWMLISYGDTLLQDTIDVFNLLVDEMERRLPGYENNISDTTSPLIEEAALGVANLRQGFLHHFARKANRPSFRYIHQRASIRTPQAYSEAVPGDNCLNFPAGHKITPEQLYSWQAVLGSEGSDCAWPFWGKEYYCVGAPDKSATTTTTPTPTPAVTPPPVQSDIDAHCKKFTEAVHGDLCLSFAEANDITAAKLYAWNLVIGADSAGCGTNF
ncbi:hypothetical protein HBI61_085030 [Parastagonospora nodorum]|nr:hypothetical protein HBI61_085030 [Parastagonospora nodorum]